MEINSSLLCDWLLQTLYAAMHEPDGVTGVNALRREEPSLREQILEHESIGLLRDATACYDRAIQLESDQVHTQTHTYMHTAHTNVVRIQLLQREKYQCLN